MCGFFCAKTSTPEEPVETLAPVVGPRTGATWWHRNPTHSFEVALFDSAGRHGSLSPLPGLKAQLQNA